MGSATAGMLRCFGVNLDSISWGSNGELRTHLDGLFLLRGSGLMRMPQ